MPVLLLRRPSKNLAQGVVSSHIPDQRAQLDYGEALRQWQGYRAVFEAHGWATQVVGDGDEGLPDAVFVEDSVVAVKNLRGHGGAFILASPGSSMREAEIAAVDAHLAEAKAKNEMPGWSLVRIEKPGTLDGGDVLKVASEGRIYVGRSARTNDEGIRQFTRAVEGLGWRVVVVPVSKALHLKSTVTALADGTIIGAEALLDDVSLFNKFVAMPEPQGVAVVHLDEQGTKLLLSASAPRSAELLRGMGYHVVTADISQFEILEGCPTCLSVRVRV
ncbi:N(G),N(G)-dimethylarginine dimethylaminohydrolase [Acaromyces ingoldii]|uniref:N(G),N(G)-dimethylarginine dimethylaminohydrolase n=1 Tax=Acaromyces ingoldii TaxID=215250 RepID=A0A316YNS0_9BASI|nr:N(G),N(G)-dimethylarginine dimethylaminohydrolase [Acaromyces ingoldii]PWN89703.1 N(G),N(G)-dimethylarginine dimethylaminohydrolase [Acaromyces ingoldii]